VEKALKNSSKNFRKLAKADPRLRTKLKKDPGVPSSFPFKERILREVEQSKRNLEEERERRRNTAHRAHEEALMADVPKTGLARFAQLAEERGVDFEHDDIMEDSFDTTEQSTKKDTSRKAHTKEFKKVVEQADVVLYVLDARDPEATRSREVETIIRESPHGEKQLVLILNKIGTFYHY
jgi:nuclear GTP-binding protein